MELDFSEIQKKLVANQNQLSKEIAGTISEQVEDATDNLENAADHAKESLDKLKACTDELQSALSECSKVAESVDVMAQKVKDLSELSDRLSAANEEIVETIGKSCGDICECADSAVDAKEEIKRLADTFSESVSRGMQCIEEIVKAFDLSRSSTEILVQEFQNDSEHIDSILLDFSNKVNQVSNCLDEYVGRAELQIEVYQSSEKRNSKYFLITVGLMVVFFLMQLLNLFF